MPLKFSPPYNIRVYHNLMNSIGKECYFEIECMYGSMARGIHVQTYNKEMFIRILSTPNKKANPCNKEGQEASRDLKSNAFFYYLVLDPSLFEFTIFSFLNTHVHFQHWKKQPFLKVPDSQPLISETKKQKPHLLSRLRFLWNTLYGSCGLLRVLQGALHASEATLFHPEANLFSLSQGFENGGARKNFGTCLGEFLVLP